MLPLSVREPIGVSQLLPVRFAYVVGDVSNRLDLVVVEVEGVEPIRGNQVAYGAVVAKIVLGSGSTVVLGRGGLERKRGSQKACKRKANDATGWGKAASASHGMGNGPLKDE